MSQSESDEFLSAEEDSFPHFSNSTHKLVDDKPDGQLDKPAYCIAAFDDTHKTQHNVEDIVDTLIKKDTTHHSANKLDSIPTESCQLDNETNTDSIVEKLCNTQIQPELQQTMTPTCEEVRPMFDPFQLEAVRTEVLTMKETGNCLYREEEFSSARDSYSSALELCPRELSSERAFLFSNRSLCLLKLEEYELALADCSQALLIDPQFSKARIRRAQLYERLEKQEEALSDYSEVLTSHPSCPQAREAVPRLTTEVEEKREALKTEALSKLRDLGDMVLKPFGISTNDFNFVQDPSTGNYSVSFGKNK